MPVHLILSPSASRGRSADHVPFPQKHPPPPTAAHHAPETSAAAPSSSLEPQILLLGDGNFQTFTDNRCRVIALPNGRLSALRSYTRGLSDSHQYSKVFVCLSILDRGNRVVTNFITLKSLLGRCHQLFPNATLFVLLPGITSDFTPAERATHQEFTTMVRNKHPSNSIVLAAPSPFYSSMNVWDPQTKQEVFQKITMHLN